MIRTLLVMLVLSLPAAAQETLTKEYNLDIPEKRIEGRDYQASAQVQFDRRPLFVRIGAAVRAQRIELALRNVRGRARFDGSLEKLLARLRR